MRRPVLSANTKRDRRLTRLTNGYSKKLENHMYSLSLYFMTYNFVHVHHTLTKAKTGQIHARDATTTYNNVYAALKRMRLRDQRGSL